MFQTYDVLILCINAVMIASMSSLFDRQRENAPGNAPVFYVVCKVTDMYAIIAIPRPESQTGKENQEEQRGN